jgi:hypothetical protein
MARKNKTIDAMRKTNPVAQSAFKTGNASGAHEKDKNKINRRSAHKEERLVERGIYPEDQSSSLND